MSSQDDYTNNFRGVIQLFREQASLTRDEFDDLVSERGIFNAESPLSLFIGWDWVLVENDGEKEVLKWNLETKS